MKNPSSMSGKHLLLLLLSFGGVGLLVRQGGKKKEGDRDNEREKFGAFTLHLKLSNFYNQQPFGTLD